MRGAHIRLSACAGLPAPCYYHKPPEGGFRLAFDAICSEDGSECEAVIRWEGASFNPLTEGDALSVKLALARTKASDYAYANGVNTVTICF